MTIVKTVGVFFVLGFLISVLSRVEYEASTTLIPESQTGQSSAANLLRQYGGFLGASANQASGNGISVSRYPDIVSSVPYLVELMNEPITFSKLDTTLTPHEYFRDIYPPSILDYIEKYTLGLPGQLVSLLRSNDSEQEPVQLVTNIDRDSVISLNSPQRGTIGKLKNRITVEADEGGLITLSAEFPDPRAAAEIGNKAKNLLKEYVQEYRTQKVNEELEFVREQVQQARKRFEEAQMELAEFRDSNVNLATAKAQTQEQELQSQYDLAFDLYNTLSQNLEQTKLKVQESTPLFTVVEPVQVPTGKSKPNNMLIFAITILVGLVVGILFIMGQGIWDYLQFKLAEREQTY